MKNSAQRANRITALVLMFLLYTITISSIFGVQIRQASAEVSGAGLTGKIVEEGVDINDNGLFEYLMIGVEVDVAEAGEYTVEAYGLLARDFGYIGVSDSQSVFFDVGVQTVYLSLKGPIIHVSRLNPANVSFISLRDGMYNVLGELYATPLSRAYLYTEFEVPGAAVLTGVIYDRGIDADENGAYDFLEVGVEVNVTGAGDFIIQAYGLLTSDFGYIGVSGSQSTYLNVGVQTVYLSLGGGTIHAFRLNPTNVYSVSLLDEGYSLLGELQEIPLSRAYLYTEFEAPGAVLTGVIYDRGIDADENGAYDFLEVGVEVNVTEAGNYVVEANSLLTSDYGFIGVWASESAFLDVGIQTVYLRFDGSIIYYSGLNPTNVSSVSLLDEGYSLLGELQGIPLSRTYLYTEFESAVAPPITPIPQIVTLEGNMTFKVYPDESIKMKVIGSLEQAIEAYLTPPPVYKSSFNLAARARKH